MKIVGGTVRLAATDLSNHLFCRHLTALNVAEARGERKPPQIRAPDLIVLQQRGLDHEKAYIETLQATGLSIRDLTGINVEDYAVAETLAAMKSGIDIIVQAALRSGEWFGRPDVLRKVDVPDAPDKWTYEPYDCKLARETKAATILQLSHYAALIGLVHGHQPENMYVVPPSSDFRAEPYRVLDYAAYYRAVRGRLDEALTGNRETYPEPTEHCDVCRWWQDCDRQWRRNDHLSLTAGISRLQRKQLVEWEIPTMQALSRMKVPLANKPRYGSKEGYVRVREQARVQVAARYQKMPVHELLALEPERGFMRLPEPSPGDIFFDLESDPYVDTRGREYLFGFGVQGAGGQFIYESQWAFTASEERAVFEWFVDYAMERWRMYPTMHIYHFGHKEPSTLKALMGLYATREDAIDRMLRAGILVDLHSITKQAVRASVEQYSLKALEEFHGFAREVALEDARAALRQVEHGLELNRITSVDTSVRKTVEGYNADDCRSTLALRDWLEALRRAEIEAGALIPRPVAQDDAPSEAVGERQARVAALIQKLTADVPSDEALRSEDEAARWLLANLLDWHRRELKVAFWEKFRLRALGDEELRDERAAIGGLEYVREIPAERPKRLPVHEYSFPPQETSLKNGDKVYSRDLQLGTIEYIDPVKGVVGVRKASKANEDHPQSIYSFKIIEIEELENSLFRFAEHAATHGLDFAPPYQVACALLLRRPPAVTLRQEGEEVVEAAKRIVLEMKDSALPIQGPPGSGKTYTAAQMIVTALAAGKRVGVTGSSHKVIRTLLDGVQSAGRSAGRCAITCVHKVTDKSDDVLPHWLSETTGNAHAVRAISNGTCEVLAGTAWLWAREEAAGLVDILFVDEAGQMSLANALAIAPAARNVVLVGDPQQLEQPLQACHPEGAEVSALEHLLQGAKTIDPRKGLFLDKTWRLHPDICRFTSELFYENRLESRTGLENQRIDGHAWLGAAGLRYLPVSHEGNQNSSIEEVEFIQRLVEGLLTPGVKWIADGETPRQLTARDILIVAPYNAQVAALGRRLGSGMRVGTVDKFQGQEAPVVIYSLTTSSPEDAPRGMEFLYSLNRLNVATSRAKALSIIVGSARLLEAECKTPYQMRLANALCRFAEMAVGLAAEERVGVAG